MAGLFGEAFNGGNLRRRQPGGAGGISGIRKGTDFGPSEIFGKRLPQNLPAPDDPTRGLGGGGQPPAQTAPTPTRPRAPSALSAAPPSGEGFSTPPEGSVNTPSAPPVFQPIGSPSPSSLTTPTPPPPREPIEGLFGGPSVGFLTGDAGGLLGGGLSGLSGEGTDTGDINALLLNILRLAQLSGDQEF